MGHTEGGPTTSQGYKCPLSRLTLYKRERRKGSTQERERRKQLRRRDLSQREERARAACAQRIRERERSHSKGEREMFMQRMDECKSHFSHCGLMKRCSRRQMCMVKTEDPNGGPLGTARRWDRA